MTKEELVEYLDARMACNLNFYTINGNTNITFHRSITKTFEGEYIVCYSGNKFIFSDASSAATCFLQRLGQAA